MTSLGAGVAWGGGRQARQQPFEIEIKIGIEIGLKIPPLLPGWWWVKADCDIDFDFDFVFARRVPALSSRPERSGEPGSQGRQQLCADR